MSAPSRISIALIDELAARGKAIILVSSELPELLRCSRPHPGAERRARHRHVTTPTRPRRRKSWRRGHGRRAVHSRGRCSPAEPGGAAGHLVLAILISPTAADGSRIFLQAGQPDRHSAAGVADRHHLAGHDVRHPDRRHRSQRGQHPGAVHVAGGDVPHARLGRTSRPPSWWPWSASAAVGAVNGAVIAHAADSAVHRHAGHHDRHSRPGQVAHRQCQHRYRLRARRGGRVRRHLPRRRRW